MAGKGWFWLGARGCLPSCQHKLKTNMKHVTRVLTLAPFSYTQSLVNTLARSSMTWIPILLFPSFVYPSCRRPGYPANAMRAIEAEIRRSCTSDGVGGVAGDDKQLLVDLGAGTGKFTRELLPFARSEGALCIYDRCSTARPHIAC